MIKNIKQKIWENVAVRSSRRGHFWIPGERITLYDKTYQNAPMFVSWEAPEKVDKPYPIILVHGGLLQSTEWLDTPDGRPGWAQRLVENGYPVFVVDRPGHGRSHTHPKLSKPIGNPFAYEEGEHVFFPENYPNHTQWPFDRNDQEAMDQFIAPFGPLPCDLEESEEMDADRLAALLDKIGPAIIMTHSASGPDGWLLADRRPDLVKAIIGIEPMGPAFATIPNLGKLQWGWTAAKINFDPAVQTPEDMKAVDMKTLKVPSLKDLPIAIVSAEASPFAYYQSHLVDFLNTVGAKADHLALQDHQVFGNGHGLIYEKNSDEALKPVLQWLSDVFSL